MGSGPGLSAPSSIPNMVIEEQPAWAQNSGLEPSASQALLFSLSHWYLWEAAGAEVVAEALQSVGEDRLDEYPPHLSFLRSVKTKIKLFGVVLT